MTDLEKSYFEKLTADREDSAKTFEKPSMAGAKSSVVDKYTDQAHFIYELLQNADDAGASSVRFVLRKDSLVFAHNGTKRFTVTNPDTEREDKENNCLGDINAITSIANSSKSSDKNTIGKFGVGFKAVFQYTETPLIFDPDVAFRIERFFVPKLLDRDMKGRKADETMFVFPFNHPQKTADIAYDDISTKLRALSYPILFLQGLKDISFEFENVIGLYGKTIKETRYFKDIKAEYICLTQNNGENIYDEYVWLFTREDEYGNAYSVGFLMDEEGKIKPVNKAAFCFFPTKESTGLHFIIHAPFLLNDSREGILAGEQHNKKMVSLLAKLAGDALVCLRDISAEKDIRLIDDDILEIIPVDKSGFSALDDRDKLSFLPFFTEIKKRFSTEAIIPAKDGYVSTLNAYWAYVTPLTEIFSNEQLGQLTGNKNAKWVFTSLGRQGVQRSNRAKSNYIDEIVKTNLEEDDILEGSFVSGLEEMGPEFIEKQSIEWLCKFYEWLSETSTRTDMATRLQIFLNSEGKSVFAFDEEDMPVLFLPVGSRNNFQTVHPELLKNEKVAEFLKIIGVTEPSLRDEIYNNILPKYKFQGDIDTTDDFIKLFSYYKQCPQSEVKDYIRLVSDCEIIVFYNKNDDESYRGRANTIYYPTDNLLKYFEAKDNARFLDEDFYKEIIAEDDWNLLTEFLDHLGVRKTVGLIEVEIDKALSSRFNLPRPYSTREIHYRETRLEGCADLLKKIEAEQNLNYSIILWNELLNTISNCNLAGYSRGIFVYGTILEYIFPGRCNYYYHSAKFEKYTSTGIQLLLNTAWLMNKNGEFCKSSDLLSSELSSEYNISGEAARLLMEALGIKNPVQNENRDILENDNLSDDQKEDIIMARLYKKLGLESEDDIKRAAELLRLEKKKEAEEEMAAEDGDEDEVPQNENIKKVTRDINRKVADLQKKKKEEIQKPDEPENVASEEQDEEDSDDYTPRAVDYSKKIEKAKEKSASEIDKIAYIEELQNRVLNAENEGRKYSYEWFTTLLELEQIYSGDDTSNSREVSISFAKVEREPGTNRTLILKHPSGHIPQFMEDLADIPLVLHTGTEKKTVAIEVINIKSYTLRVKLKTNAEIGDFDLRSVKEATINAQNPVFLLEELRRQFLDLGYEPDYNLKENLPENIEFVFGPPGTGKTTHLARNVILPLMESGEKPRVLVLTPTNKSADVLATRIMEVSEDNSYENWLARFGGTGDETLEQSPVFRDKTFDIQSLEQSVVITTIARFPYDYFMPAGKWLYLREMKWDYIIIDEASMIPIANIVYPLFKKEPNKFVIAGDPFQIEPIVAVEQWKDENIYTMVELNSFVNPTTKPHDYKVELLTTQYRSIPAVGEVFSKLTYGGILKHHREASSQRPLNIEDEFEMETLNIIKFPVSKYESIYRPKRLQGKTPYHIYSALFSCEFTEYLSGIISKSNPDETFRIGIISTYRAQADLIDKLLLSMKLPENVDVQVGTIHGFQGDECDIIIAVYNPPPAISKSSQMFLNKRNIINVSVSRARDYMIVIMPDDDTENVDNLKLIKRVEKLFKASCCYKEYGSHEIEETMFGNPNYLEDNSFSTSHQSVNVYGLPEKYYEIRSEDTAVDVQIHKNANGAEPIKKKSNKYVYDKDYGKGEVILKWRDEKGRKLIKVKFDNSEKDHQYLEEIAFSSGALCWVEE